MASTCTAFEVADSAEFIASQSERVFISQAGVQDAAAQLLSAPLHSGFGAGDALEPLGLDDGAVLEWLFLVDTMNFCFWSDEPTLFTVEYQERRWTGYRAMVAALAKAVEAGTPVYRPAYYRNITCDQLSTIFASTTHVKIPLLNERADVLHEASRVLEERFAGSVKQLVAAASGSVQKLIGLLAQNFSSYCDVAEYKGRQVHFLKRAQIFAADVWSRFGGKGVGEFGDIDSITMFADYRVPQCLCYLGVLEYSSELRGRLRVGQHLTAGSEEEVEIRGCSIAAVERIRRQMSACTSKAKHVTSAQIDFYLWNFAKTHSNEMEGYPIHRTLTVFY